MIAYASALDVRHATLIIQTICVRLYRRHIWLGFRMWNGVVLEEILLKIWKCEWIRIWSSLACKFVCLYLVYNNQRVLARILLNNYSADLPFPNKFMVRQNNANLKLVSCMWVMVSVIMSVKTRTQELLNLYIMYVCSKKVGLKEKTNI